MMEQKDISVIIPQKNSIRTLGRLFDSIPDDKRIEIIVVDNSEIPITKDDIGIDREYDLYWAAPSRYAGGARNVGLEHANGKWLVFADADDFYSEGAFDVFFSQIEDDADVIYFGMGGMYDDTGEYAPRGEYYTNKVKKYLSGETDENDIRLLFGTPCSKMVRKALVDKYNIRFDEVVVCNDSFFAQCVGYYAETIKAVDKIVYIATVSRGSLTRRKDFDAVFSRYWVKLRMNQFLREKNLGAYQVPVMSNIVDCCKAQPSKTIKVLSTALKYRQNLFLGFGLSNWIHTLFKKKSAKEIKYDVK